MEKISFKEILDILNMTDDKSKVYDYITNIRNKKPFFKNILKQKIFAGSMETKISEALELDKKEMIGFMHEGHSSSKKEGMYFIGTPSNRPFLSVKIGKKDKLYDDNVDIKLYYKINANDIYTMFKELSEYCYNNEIELDLKTRVYYGNDMVTLRIKDPEVLDSIIDIINKYKIEDDLENQFIPTYRGIGTTFDFGVSYNTFLCEKLMEYVKSQNEELFSEEDFYEYLKRILNKFDLRKEEIVFLENLKNAMSKKELDLDYIKNQTKYINEVVIPEDKILKEKLQKFEKLQNRIMVDLSDIRFDELDSKINELLAKEKIEVEDESQYSMREIFYDMSDEEIKNKIINKYNVIKKNLSIKKLNDVKTYAKNILSFIVFNAAIKLENGEDVKSFIKQFTTKENIIEGIDISLLDMMNYYISDSLNSSKSFESYVLLAAKTLLEDKNETKKYLEKYTANYDLDDFEVDDFDEDDVYYDLPTSIAIIEEVETTYDVSVHRINFKDYCINHSDLSGRDKEYYERIFNEQKTFESFPGYGSLIFKFIAYEKGYDQDVINSDDSNFIDKIIYQYCTDYIKESDNKLKR